MFIVIEMQTTGGVTSTIATTYENENEAYQKFYQILSFAVVSDVDVHTAVVMNEYGAVLKADTYAHNVTQE